MYIFNAYLIPCDVIAIEHKNYFAEKFDLTLLKTTVRLEKNGCKGNSGTAIFSGKTTIVMKQHWGFWKHHTVYIEYVEFKFFRREAPECI